MTDEEALKIARAEGKRPCRRKRDDARGCCVRSRAAMKLDLLLFGRIESGPFFALLDDPRADPDASTDEDALCGDRPDRARAPREDRCTSPPWRKGSPALGHEVTALITPGEGPPRPSRVRWVPMAPPFGSSHLRLLRSGDDRGASRAAIRPDAIIERYHNFGGEASARRAKPNARGACSRSTRRSSITPGSSKALLDRALAGRADAPLARAPLRARRSDRHAERARSCRAAIPRASASTCSNGAPTRSASVPVPAAQPPFVAPGRRHVAVFAGAFRRGMARSTSSRRSRSCARAAAATSAPCSSATAPSCRACAQAARGLDTIVSPARCRTTGCRRRSPRADIGVAPFDIGAHAPLSLGFYWSPLKMFEYMASGLPVVAPGRRSDSLAGRRWA